MKTKEQRILITSPNDGKQYLAFTLDNGLRVVAIQDQDSEKSAASLTVNCGHFDDPSDRQGMAHFVEHMLFLGTRSEPEPGAFHQFISGHGGSHNAWTGTEFTSYFFDINNQFLRPALTRFSQFFNEPLLAQEYVEKERNNIDSEYKLKLKEDSHRIYQVHKETINQAHPFSKFSVGNSETLADRNGNSIRDELVAFHQRYYLPHDMTLVVLGKMSLPEQQQMVTELFGPIKDSPGYDRMVNTPLYLSEHQRITIEIEPHKHSQKLIASFDMPNTDQHYQHKTVQYLAHLVGYEGAGSLLSALKRRGWCNSLSAGRGASGSNFKDFNISFDLTNAGLEQCDAIIEMMFEYFDLLGKCTDHQQLYGDKQKLLQLAFDYQEKSKPINYVSHLSLNMFTYEPEHYVYGDYMMIGFDRQEFDQLWGRLSANNMRLILIHPEVKTDRVAKWYETPYNVTPFGTDKTIEWQNISCQSSELKLPTANPYLKNEVRLEPRVTAEITAIPQVIDQAEGYNFYFKQDELFDVPKGHCYLAIDCPVSTSSVQNIAVTRLFTELFLDQVLEDHYNAELAGLSYHVYVHQGGLTVHTSGISTNQHLLIEQLLIALQTLSFSRDRFNELKNQLSSHWLNSSKSKPVSQLFAILTATLQPNNPTMEQMANALLDVTFDAFIAVREQLFTQVHIDAFAYGNWTKDQALLLSTKIKQIVFTKAKPHPEIFRPLLSLQNQHHLVIEKSLKHYDNAIVIYYQAADRSAESSALYILLNHIISPSFFHQLRTERQLGYLVGTGFVPLNRFPGLAVYIQSPDYDSHRLLKEIESFMQQFCQEILEISGPKWLKIQKGVVTQVVEKDSNLRLRSQRFWFGIGNKDFQFNERDLIAEQIMCLTPKDLQSFARKILLSNTDAKLMVMTRNEEALQSPLTSVEPHHLSTLLKPLNI